MGDVVGKVLGIILAFILCIIAPLTVTVMADDMSDRRLLYSELTNFVDEVVDTATITEEQLTDLYAGLNSYGPICEVKVYRYMRAANPNKDGKVEVTYMPMDISVDKSSIISFNTGDMIKVELRAVDYAGTQRIARGFLGAFLKPIEYSVTARVR